jgi:hypothetical protein
MLSEQRLAQIHDALGKVSPAPWDWGYKQNEVPTDGPELRECGIDTLPSAPHHIQLRANGRHRFWVELTDTSVAGDVVFDFDFIICAREWVPELLAEVERLRGLLGQDAM